MKIKKHGMYELNPSYENVIGIKEVCRSTKNNTEIVVNTKTGELLEIQPVKSLTTVIDTNTFVKVYQSSIDSISDLTVPSLKLMCYIMKHIKPNKDIIRLKAETCNKYCGYKTKLSFYKGLEDLLEKKFIYRTEDEFNYWININYFFNGDRMTIVKENGKPKEEKPKIDHVSNFENEFIKDE